MEVKCLAEKNVNALRWRSIKERNVFAGIDIRRKNINTNSPSIIQHRYLRLRLRRRTSLSVRLLASSWDALLSD